ncbi:MAG: hypothetical protein AAFQ51_03150 [Pseudomonadota bacterium]
MRHLYSVALALLLPACAMQGDSASTLNDLPDRYTWDIGWNVAVADIDVIVAGLEDSERFYEAVAGYRLSDRERDNWTVTIVSTGRGDPWGGGACCTAKTRGDGAETQLFFDVAHPHWRAHYDLLSAHGAAHTKIVMHEFAHGLQIDHHSSHPDHYRLSNWMREGMAEYFAYRAMIEAGLVDASAVERRLFEACIRTAIMGQSIRDLEDPRGRFWPGDIGFLAITGLVELAPNGADDLLAYVRSLGQGTGRDAAFEASFGLSLEEFYDTFDTWRESARSNHGIEPVWSRYANLQPRIASSIR